MSGGLCAGVFYGDIQRVIWRSGVCVDGIGMGLERSKSLSCQASSKRIESFFMPSTFIMEIILAAWSNDSISYIPYLYFSSKETNEMR